VGIQTAVFRYQITGQGNSLIPITTDLNYIFHGTYSGRTALSVLFWTLGTVLLVLSSLITLVYLDRFTKQHLKIIKLFLMGAIIAIIASCCTQYGLLLSGPAGLSLPFGGIILLMFVLCVHVYGSWVFDLNRTGSES
jgi:hypothetical protein